ncbi:DUF1223 domain-containing protein [Chitinophaga tropicalis]|uniref:DUF1223 domain-containing protein n=1 Tax=Chitinophaga tropicalis TaxID=2683588 RepID=A0A7K1U3U6_9BACT|nr:DUF1223 domain-containing protein [Chitinophaga tropicalis]MVT09037.1 DUF1223 domain-containing protein [Chitinophaga tropicalis]
MLKNSMLYTILVLLVSITFLSFRSNASKAEKWRRAAGNGFAVLELFTSEGCSSCPPADALLERIQKEAGNKPVYVLAYHVDYWNRLGWKDVFSDAKYSERQYQYSRFFKGQVYTPQVVINGRSECIGSDEAAVSQGITQGLSSVPTVGLTIEARQEAGNIALNYQVTGNTRNDQLLIAVVQKHAVSKVKRGENEGRTLSHAQIVRKLYVFDLKKGEKAKEQIPVPEDFNAQEWEIVGMVQDPENGVIAAAARSVVL